MTSDFREQLDEYMDIDSLNILIRQTLNSFNRFVKKAKENVTDISKDLKPTQLKALSEHLKDLDEMRLEVNSIVKSLKVHK